ncbi:hypothetical protein RB653_007595 [Dictyostelium firmibasis]|uniref:Alpha-and gamma-adaptin-binding protein p34 n=1 Tax=Dictyostelium firmibasis TaxID=79012 RepID=A0AAN7YP62_9MYCE
MQTKQERNILYLLGDKEIDKIQIFKDKEYIINTKYYSANINIETIDLDKENCSIKLNHNDNVSAIVLTFDSSKPESFNFIKSYIKINKQIDQFSDDDDDDNNDSNNNGENEDEEQNINEILYILVDVNKSKNEIEDQIEEWCIEHLIEWVIFDSNSHKEYDIRKSDLTEIDEKIKYGSERLIEILESNMWPKMELKNNGGSKKSEEKKEIKEDIEDEYPSIKNDKFLQDSLKKVEGFFKKSAPPIQNNNIENKEKKVKTNGLSIEEDKDEIDDENDDSTMMENTFKELQSLREHMKNLPDEQRRDMAAKIAMMFASSLNFEDD